MIPKLQEFSNNKDLFSQRKNGLILFKYSKDVVYESKWDEVSLWARGIVFEEETGNLITAPFKKFFNFEEENFQKILNTIPKEEPFEVTEKADGSCIFISNYKDTWFCHTPGSFESEQSKWAWDWITKNIDLNKLDKDYTYICEYIARHNRIVVDYGTFEGLILLAVKHRKTLKELPYEELKIIASNLNLNIVKKYDFSSFEELFKARLDLTVNQEGWVILYPRLNIKFKLKGEEYCKMHRLQAHCTERTIWEFLSTNQSLDQYKFSNSEEIRHWVEKVEKNLNRDFSEIKEKAFKIFDQVKSSTNNQKEFAIKLLSLKSGLDKIIFCMYHGNPYDKLVWDVIYPPADSVFRIVGETEDV